MNISIAVVIFLLTVFASISLNGIMRNIAKNNRWLIDIPDKNMWEFSTLDLGFDRNNYMGKSGQA